MASMNLAPHRQSAPYSLIVGELPNELRDQGEVSSGGRADGEGHSADLISVLEKSPPL